MAKRRVYQPGSKKAYRLSRSQIEESVNCPKCFYLNRRVGVPHLPSYPFSLNSAVDSLLKNEFDIYRETQEPHPIMLSNNIEAVPFYHDDIDTWRSNFKGIEWLDEEKNLIICGAIDDVWINDNDELIIVDYKATAKKGHVTITADWQAGYRRQMEIYQWIMRKMDYEVSETGYFVYSNGDGYRPRFDNALQFHTELLPYKGNTAWVEDAIEYCYKILNSEDLPESGKGCGVCEYNEAISQL